VTNLKYYSIRGYDVVLTIVLVVAIGSAMACALASGNYGAIVLGACSLIVMLFCGDYTQGRSMWLFVVVVLWFAVPGYHSRTDRVLGWMSWSSFPGVTLVFLGWIALVLLALHCMVVYKVEERVPPSFSR
jgi:hypothetical protein